MVCRYVRELAEIKYVDIFKSNVGKALSGKSDLYSQGFMGLASKTDDKIDVICGGTDGKTRVKLKGLDGTSFENKDILVSIEGVFYKGLSGIVSEPEKIMQYKARVRNGSLTIDMPEIQQENAYHITVKEWTDDSEIYDNSEYLPQRFEAEHGWLLGDAYTYDSAYATTGEAFGMVGGMETSGDGVRMEITVPENGQYDLFIIYGKSNDGNKKEDRVSAKVNFSFDGKTEILTLPNTIKSEYTDFVKYTSYLEKGTHSLEFTNNSGTYVIDSVLVEKSEEKEEIHLIPDEDRSEGNISSYLAVAPYDGYYRIETDASRIEVNDNKAEKGELVYLPRGLNFIDLENCENLKITKTESENENTIYAKDITLSDGAMLTDGYIHNISNLSCKGEFTVNAPEAGTYYLTFTYSNNDEKGVHSYNVDLVERYVTVTVNGESYELYCRNTYSWETYKTVSLAVDFRQGENIVTLTNSGFRNFNGYETFIPHIKEISVNPLVK